MIIAGLWPQQEQDLPFANMGMDVTQIHHIGSRHHGNAIQSRVPGLFFLIDVTRRFDV